MCSSVLTSKLKMLSIRLRLAWPKNSVISDSSDFMRTGSYLMDYFFGIGSESYSFLYFAYFFKGTSSVLNYPALLSFLSYFSSSIESSSSSMSSFDSYFSDEYIYCRLLVSIASVFPSSLAEWISSSILKFSFLIKIELSSKRLVYQSGFYFWLIGLKTAY